MSFKITIIGAGSVGFTKKLVSDILKVPEFAGIEIALTDINGHNLDMIAQIIRRLVEVNNLPTRVTATTDRREALTGARYVMNCVRIGGLEAFADDISIPLISAALIVALLPVMIIYLVFQRQILAGAMAGAVK